MRNIEVFRMIKCSASSVRGGFGSMKKVTRVENFGPSKIGRISAFGDHRQDPLLIKCFQQVLPRSTAGYSGMWERVLPSMEVLPGGALQRDERPTLFWGGSEDTARRLKRCTYFICIPVAPTEVP